METKTKYPHITVTAGNVPRIGDTRHKVIHLAGEHYYYGWTAEELMRQHPDLRPEEVYAALTYFYDHYQVMVDELEQQATDIEEKRKSQTFSRSELLARKPGSN